MKPREFWINKGSNNFDRSDSNYLEPYYDSVSLIPHAQMIHVIEKSVYDKAIAALKRTVWSLKQGNFLNILVLKDCEKILKELGEQE